MHAPRNALRSARCFWLAASACLAASLAGAQGTPPAQGDPFGSGRRWSFTPPTGEAWIPRDVTFAGQGELVWAAPAVGDPRLQLFASGELGPTAPLHETNLSGAIGRVRVAAGDEPDELFALAQYPDPDGAQRRTLVSRYDAYRAAYAQALAPVWLHDLGSLVNGPAFLESSRDGARVAVAVYDNVTAQVQVDVLDGSTGELALRVYRDGSAVRAFALSADGARLAISAGLDLWVLDAVTLTTLHHETLAVSSPVLSLSADGGVVAFGDLGRVRILAWQAGAYASAFELPAASEELAVGAALSADASTLAVSWWNAVTGVAIRCVVVDVGSHSIWNTLTQAGPLGGLQNYPAALAITDDGTRVALGLWGAGDARPELVLLERGVTQPVLEADLVGSVYALAFDPSGTRVALGTKDAHANLFSSTGVVQLYDTGERELQLTAAPRPGGAMEVAFRLPQPGLAVFAAGLAATSPVTLPGIGGVLWLDPQERLVIEAVAPDPNLRADWDVPLQANTSLVGLPIGVQAASVVGGSIMIGERLVRVFVL